MVLKVGWMMFSLRPSLTLFNRLIYSSLLPVISMTRRICCRHSPCLLKLVRLRHFRILDILEMLISLPLAWVPLGTTLVFFTLGWSPISVICVWRLIISLIHMFHWLFSLTFVGIQLLLLSGQFLVHGRLWLLPKVWLLRVMITSHFLIFQLGSCCWCLSNRGCSCCMVASSWACSWQGNFHFSQA